MVSLATSSVWGQAECLKSNRLSQLSLKTNEIKSQDLRNIWLSKRRADSRSKPLNLQLTIEPHEWSLRKIPWAASVGVYEGGKCDYRADFRTWFQSALLPIVSPSLKDAPRLDFAKLNRSIRYIRTRRRTVWWSLLQARSETCSPYASKVWISASLHR